ncbi:MAG: heme exporter protein CcmB [Myxococcales bacterium]|nr:heme exporter protein CcmB [Myxococcales bacterium]
MRAHSSWTRQAWLVLRKDVAIELATGEIVTTAGFFALLIVVVASLAFFSGPDVKVNVAPGVIWVAIAFASVLALGRSWQREREHDALSGMLVMPLSRSALFVGKAIGLFAFVVGIELVVLPVAALMFDVSLARVGPGLLLICLCATPGIAASGTLFGAMTVRTQARDLVLAVVLFPLLAPTLLAAVAATRELFAGATLAEVGDYFALMGVFGLLFTLGGLGLFETLIEA